MNEPNPSDDALDRFEQALGAYRDVTAEVTQEQREYLASLGNAVNALGQQQAETYPRLPPQQVQESADLWNFLRSQENLPNRERLGDPQEIAVSADLQNFLGAIEREPEPAQEPEPLPPGPSPADLQQVLSQFDEVLQQLEQQTQSAPSIHVEPGEVPIPEPQTPPESLSPPEPDEGPSERPEASGAAQEPVDWQESRSLLGELWEGISDAVQIVPNWLDEVLPDLTGPWVDELLSGLGGWVGSFFGSGESPLSPEPEATEPPAEAREASWWQEIPEVQRESVPPGEAREVSWWQEIPEVQREPVPLPEPELAAEEPVPAPLPAPEVPEVEGLTPEEELAQLEQVAKATAERSRDDKQEILSNLVRMARGESILTTAPEQGELLPEETESEEEPTERDIVARGIAERAQRDKQEILANLAALAPAASEEVALPKVEGVEPLAEIPEPLVEELETAAETEREDTPVDAGQAEPATEVLGEIREGISTLVDLMREFVQQKGETAQGDVSGPDRAPGHRSYAPPDVPSGASPSIHWRSTWGRRPAESEEEGGE